MQEEARRNFELAGIHQVETVNEDVITFLHSRTNSSADAIFCIGFLHHLVEEKIAIIVSEAARLLKPGGSLLLSEPRRVNADSIPQEIADWNSRSVAARLNYSHTPEAVPKEEPIEEEKLLVGNPGQDERDSGMIPNGVPG